MQSTWLAWAPKMQDYTKSEHYYYDYAELDLPLFYRPKLLNEDGRKEDYSTEEVLKWAIDDAEKEGYPTRAFVEEIVDRYEAWRW